MSDLHSRFNMFDRNEDGILEDDEIGIVMRLMGATPTENELQEQINNVNGQIDELGLNNLINDNIDHSTNISNELLACFKTFDQDESGEIYVNELRNVLCFLGETMEAADVDKLLKNVKISLEGKINYTDFIHYLLK